MRGEDP
jgi:hypothetical protein